MRRDSRPANNYGVRSLQDQKLIIISARCGRLANRITLFATFVAWVEEQGYQLMNPTFHSYAHHFQGLSDDIYCQYPPPSRASVIDLIPGLARVIRGTRLFPNLTKYLSLLNARKQIFGKKVVTLLENRKAKGSITPLESAEIGRRIQDARIVLVNGWTFRAPGCVRRHEDKVRKFFRPLAKHAEASGKAAERARSQADALVGVHIRRGDYANWRYGRYLFPVSRYCQWMKEMARQLGGRKVSFLVCSNEPRSIEEFPGLSVGFSTGVPVEDLYALAECDYLMGPVSSFTQWASFYGKIPLLYFSSEDMIINLQEFQVSYLAEVPN